MESLLAFFRVQVVSAIEIAICVGNGSSCGKSPFYKIYNRKKYETVLNPKEVKNVSCCSMDIKMQLIQEASRELCTACTAWVQWALHTILAWQSQQLFHKNLQGTVILQNSRRMSWKGCPCKGHCSKPLSLFQDINDYFSRLPLLIPQHFRHIFLKKSEEESTWRPRTTTFLQLIPYHLFLFPLPLQVPMFLLSQTLEIWALATCSCRGIVIGTQTAEPKPWGQSYAVFFPSSRKTTPTENAHFFCCAGDVRVLCWWATSSVVTVIKKPLKTSL